MDWKTLRRNKFSAESDDGQIGYSILPKKNGKYFIKAYLPGGAEYRLPFQDFETAQDAMIWVEQHEQERAERKAQRANDKPIYF